MFRPRCSGNRPAPQKIWEKVYTLKAVFEQKECSLRISTEYELGKHLCHTMVTNVALRTVRIRSILFYNTYIFIYIILQYIIEQFHVLVGIDDDISNEFSGYSINVEPGLSLDIPKSAYSTSKYCATLG